MKKLVAISVLLVFLTAAAFAQFKVDFYTDFYPNLIEATAPFGDFADDANAAYAGGGTFDFFTTNYDWYTPEMRLGLKYTGVDEKYEAYVQVKADGLLNRNIIGDMGTGDAQTGINIQRFWDAPFGDWYVWGKVGALKAYAGNTGDRGIASDKRYNTPFSYYFDNILIYHYGVIHPSVPDPTDPTERLNPHIDAYNIGKYTYTDGANGGRPYFSLTADLAPIKVAVAGDLTNVIAGQVTNSYNRVGAAVRVSGDTIADLVSFDAIYKIYGGDPTTEDKTLDQPDGEGIWGHTFGLVANLSLFDTLGIGIGYTGYTVAQEKGVVGTSSDPRYIYPYYNGIDLRFNFTGIDKLELSFNNNISFSAFTGDDDSNTSNIAVSNGSYTGFVDNSDVSAGYVGLFNGLGAKFQVTDDLFATLALENILRTTTVTNKIGDTIVTENTYDTFRAVLGAGYSFGTHVLLESGLVFDVDNTLEKVTGGAGTELKGGVFTFAIPIRFKVALP